MYVKVHAFPGSKKERVTKLNETTFAILVREPAERNLANQRLREILAMTYTIPLASVRIITGHHSRSKVFDVAINT